jgi:Methyltransferase domain
MLRFLFKLLRSNKYTSDFAALFLLRRRSSFLKQVGWYDSFRSFRPVDGNGEAIPWYTYAAIDYLGGRVGKDMTVFEYGSGNSTIWWAQRVLRVVSCEHDEEWFASMRAKVPGNVKYLHFDLADRDRYANEIKNYDKEFDVIVIDGRRRVDCAKNCLGALKDTGVIVWDNSDRDSYREGYDFLTANGFKRLDFSGLGPINAYGWCTSVFYRAQNSLGI